MMKEAKTEKEEIRGIIRLSGRDIKGEVPLNRAIMKVKGVGIRLANIMSKIVYSEFNLPKNVVIGQLNDEEVEKLEEMLTNPTKYGVPTHFLNRQKDVESGKDAHLIGSELTFSVKQDIERNKEMNSWKGFRHLYGQKVRGQHTRTTGRTGMSVGVLRKTILAKAGAAAQAAQAGAVAPIATGPAATAVTPTAPAAPVKKEVKPVGKEEKK
jgi:small subunit ribosomal protein S13